MENLEVLYEDNHIIAINKKVSDISQPDITGDVSLDRKVKDYLIERYKKPGEAFLGIAHRLDRPVSGVLVFAKTSKALSRLNEMIREREMQKHYLAIVKNKPPKEEDILSFYILKNQKQNKSYTYDHEVPKSKFAAMTYKTVSKSDNYYLLLVELETGRHHQIRAGLSMINCPVKGDLKYGFPRSNSDSGISLHAWKIFFLHPVRKEPLEIIAPPPNDNLWNELMRNSKSLK